MLRKRLNSGGYGQLRWVILLLAVAVILPTVCLLWFMTQAVKNERLAIRQKLINMYTNRAEVLFLEYADSSWSSIENTLRNSVNGYSDDIWCFPENYVTQQQQFAAFAIYDEQKKLVYPIPSSQMDNINLPDTIWSVWELEYTEKNFEQAIKQYNSIARISSIPDIVYQCKTGIARSLSKQGKIEDAIVVYNELAYPDKDMLNKYTPAQIGRARLMLASLYSKTNHKDLQKELRRQFLNSRQSNDPNFAALPKIPTEIRIFILNELISLAEANGLADELKSEIEKARQVINSGGISLAAVESLGDGPIFQSWPEGTLRKIQSQQSLYGIHLTINDKYVLGLVTPEQVSQFWQKAADDFTDELVFCRIYDDKGEQIAGEPRYYAGGEYVFGAVFSTLNLKKYFQDWKIELYLRAGVFKEAAEQRMSIYIWVAAVVIGLMLISSAMAGRAVLKQAKLNKLKNDFVATVSHELKTPLSSMRVLADTLLEGSYKDHKQASEYLQLICKENKRLSGLIDNFLTFSRMERNKQAFEMVKTSPAAIARAAAEAVKTEFAEGRCEFQVQITENLPDVLADRDAMVTVLVNLLDNAYKYSLDDKRIELEVFAENGSVCFRVSDNGIGISRRAAKRIFKRFYQVDRSLARHAEGCGLGLSIAKFIVDAHNGTISVDSKSGEGSTFTVKLPAIN